jgi:hypothetical protein
MHVIGDVDPREDEYLPEVQSVHDPVPGVSLYVPATHSWQGPLSAPEKPALHEQYAAFSPLSILMAHALQASGPDEDLNFEASHAVQDPAGPVVPAGHKSEQSSSVSLPDGEVVLEGHCTHRASDVAPGVLEYLPMAHRRQSDAASLPTVSRYVPVAQSWHVVLDGDPTTSENLPSSHDTQSPNV